MSYITVTLNHFRMVKAWIDSQGAEASLNPSTFELEIRSRNRYFVLQPQFRATISGKLVNVQSLSEYAHGFIGWLPYRPISWPMSSDKLVFKDFLAKAGLSTPAWSAAPDGRAPYVYKRSMGSFGYELIGPFRADDAHAKPPATPGDRGELFCEEFVCGRNVKAWFWGKTPFYVQVQDYPTILGDGMKTIGVLIADKLRAAAQKLTEPTEIAAMQSSLRYQHCGMEDVLAAGRSIWIDYRYGRLFAPATFDQSSDNCLASIGEQVRAQLSRAGQVVAGEMFREFPMPLLYTLDGVMRETGEIAWLEMNTNPILAPDGYRVMLDDLFGVRPAAGAGNVTPAAIRETA